MQWGLGKCRQAGRAGGGACPDFGERKEKRTGDLSSLNPLCSRTPMDHHPPWWAVLPLAHLQRELRDLPTRHAGDPETHCRFGRVFGVLSRAVSGVRAGGRAPVLGEQRAALRTEAEGTSGPAGLSGWLCPVLTPGVVEAQSSREALKHPWVHILSWDPGRGSLRAEGMIRAPGRP